MKRTIVLPAQLVRDLLDDTSQSFVCCDGGLLLFVDEEDLLLVMDDDERFDVVGDDAIEAYLTKELM